MAGWRRHRPLGCAPRSHALLAARRGSGAAACHSMCRLVFILISARVGLSSRWASHATLPCHIASILLRAEDAGFSDDGCVEARPSCALLRLQLSPESTHRGTFREKLFEVSCVHRVRSSGRRGGGPAHTGAARLSQPLPTLRQQARGTAELPIYELLELIQTVDARALMESALLVIITSFVLAKEHLGGDADGLPT